MSENGHVAGSDDNDTTFARVQIDDPYIDFDKVIEEESKKIESIEIHVGKEFKSPDEAYGFYNLYALVKGFSIRRNQRETSRKGLSGLKFVCSKQGLSERQKHKGKPADSSSKPKTPEKERSSTRTDCKAYMRCKLVDGAIWQVSRFHDEHNHQLTSNSPSKLRNLRSHRCLTMEDIEIIRSLSDQNVGPSKIAEYLAQLHGGKRKALFRTKDVSNVIATDNKKLIGVDIDRILLFFQRKQEDDPEFFYAIDADEDGFVKHIFWADGRARRAYLEFGDVVTFDTTYNTNKYSMPLAPFIGVNHHRQSIFFGMALVRSENTDNFCWLFETWLKAMYGKHPPVIITDQDPAMRNAIKIVFPNAVHRCCQWHVMRKAREKLGSLYGRIPTLPNDLGSVINCTLTISEFEDAWAAMLEKHKLKDNKHLKNMFASREEWVPAYFRGIFFAEMTTTQRSESMNALFKMWVTTHTSIYKFVCRIDNIIENIWQREGDEDMRTMNEEPSLWSKFPLELHARRVYTRKAFSVFKELLKDSCLGIVKEIERDKLYEVEIKDNPDFKHWVPVSYLVKVDKEAELYSCNCKGFEFDGLICPHAMKVMWIHGIQHLPSHYILKRWCRDANANIKRPMNERSRDVGNSLALQMFRATTLKAQFSHLIDLASKDAQSFNLVESKLNELINQLEPLQLEDLSEKLECRPPNEESVMAVDEKDDVPENSVVLRDPPISRCKGRKKRPLRWKPAAEKAPIKGRTCSYCGIMAKHNIRTCPKKLEDQGRGKKEVQMAQEVDGEDVDGQEDDEEVDDEEEDEEDYE